MKIEAPIDPIPSHTPVAGSGFRGISFAGFRGVFATPDFRRLFWGQGISALGDWVGTLAFIVAAQHLAPDRPAAVAFVLILRLLPSFFATPIGGVLSDRWDRKRIMVWSDLARFGLLAAVPFVPKIGALYAFAFVHECFSLLFLPARDASLPNIVPVERLEAANAMVMGSSFAGIPLSGPIFAGLAWMGAHYPSGLAGAHVFRARPYAFAIMFDALTFIVSAFLIQRMHLPRRERTIAAAEPFRDSLNEGWRYIRERPLLRGLAWAVTVGMLGGGVLFALGIGYVRETLGGGDVEFGWLMGLFGGGMVCGFAISQLQRSVQWMVRIALLTLGGVLICMAILTWLWLAYLMAAVFGASFSVCLIVSMSAVQANTHDSVRGRVMGFVHMLVRVSLLIGAATSAMIATFVPAGGLDVPFISFQPDKNQVALIVAGALIIAGSLGVRGRETR